MGANLDSSETRVGFIYAVAAFLLWGLSPAFWKLLGSVPADELLAHRVLWCGVLILPILLWRRQLGSLKAILSDRKTLATLLLTTLLIGSNWFVYIWSVATDRILHASLGYFINPLLSVLLGLIFLGEELERSQWFAIALAGGGVSVTVKSSILFMVDSLIGDWG